MKKRMSCFDLLIIEELKLCNILNSKNDVQSVIWFPIAPYDNYTCSVRTFEKNKISLEFDVGFIKKVYSIGNYINLILDSQIFVEKITGIIINNENSYEIKSLQNIDVIVEHTSLTPVYPINIATFRSSVLGNALANVYSMYGANVTVHYLVSDKAKNVELLLENYHLESVISKSNGKPDHFCGQLYCNALRNIGKFDSSLNYEKMFPLSKLNCFETISFLNFTEEDRKNYCTFCLQGHLETLSDANIKFNKFDFESKIIHQIECELSKDDYIINKYENGEIPKYLFSNYAYYFSISKDNNTRIHSVINCRQENLIRNSIALLDNKNIYPLFFNDIYFFENNECNVDSISNGFFHSVDEYVNNAVIHFKVDKTIVYNALKLLLLSVKTKDTINMSDFDDLKKYIDIIIYIKNMDNLKSCSDVSLEDIFITKKIISLVSVLSFDIIYINQQDFIFNIHKVVNCIESLISIICFNYEKRKFINTDLLKSSKKILLQGLYFLGVEIEQEAPKN